MSFSEEVSHDRVKLFHHLAEQRWQRVPVFLLLLLWLERPTKVVRGDVFCDFSVPVKVRSEMNRVTMTHL